MFKTILSRYLRPVQLVVLSFVGVIFFGTILLAMPFATKSGESISLIDAFFTATSATSVTGLAVVDTGSTFSIFGQLVILTCIQIGGLGLMVFTTVFLVAMGKRLEITNRIAIQQSFTDSPTGNIQSLVKYIVIASFITEAIGALFLTVWWTISGRFETFGETVYFAIFHSISAFCNAGFALFPDSLTQFQSDGFSLFIFSGLIISGGLGFIVGMDLKDFIIAKFINPFWSKYVDKTEAFQKARPILRVHTKFVLWTTGLLLIIGTVSYFFLERNGLFKEMSFFDALLNSYFSSVTTRTAGFNSFDYAQMGASGLLCTMVLMFIGASPGSAGGGVKTSTFGVLVAYSLTRWRGSINLNIFNRTISRETLDKANAVVLSAIALIILASSVLMAFGTLDLELTAGRVVFVDVIFETISAFSTVGLSIGHTANLTTPGKILVAFVMFIGRLGPITLALAISLSRQRTQIKFAEENVIVG